MVTARNTAADAQSQQNPAQSIGKQAADTAATVMERGRELGSQAVDRASGVASNIGSKADATLSTVGQQMTGIADTIRQTTGSEGTIGTAATNVADRLQTTGQYLSEHTMQDIAGDLTSLVKRYPVQAVWVGLGLGIVVGRSLSRR